MVLNNLIIKMHLYLLRIQLTIIILLNSAMTTFFILDDVKTCITTKQEVRTMRVKRMSGSDGPGIVAGKQFLLW